MDRHDDAISLFVKELKGKINKLTDSNGTSYLNSNLKAENPEVFSSSRLEELVSSTISILSKLYGLNHSHVKDFMDKVKMYRSYSNEEHQILNCCLGKLNAIESDIKFGLLNTIEKQISGEVFGDFIKAAKASFEENQKDIAAVLACAALEDLLKRLGKINSLAIEDKSMNDVVNSLKRAGIIKGPQASLIGAYVTLRNKTFHAEWNKIDAADVKSLISFTEQMLLQNFG